VRTDSNSKIRDVTNGIKAYPSPSIVWFEDKPNGSWWACNTLIKTHWNKRDLEVVHV